MPSCLHEDADVRPKLIQQPPQRSRIALTRRVQSLLLGCAVHCLKHQCPMARNCYIVGTVFPAVGSVATLTRVRLVRYCQVGEVATIWDHDADRNDSGQRRATVEGKM